MGDTSGGDPFSQGGGGEFGDGGFNTDDPFGGGDGFGAAGDFGGDADMSSPDFTPVGGGDEFGAGGDFSGAPEEGEPQVVQGKPIDFNGLGIGLGLVPCIFLLLLAGVGAWELVRSMWSWEQPFSLTGPVLEMIGNLLKLWK